MNLKKFSEFNKKDKEQPQKEVVSFKKENNQVKNLTKEEKEISNENSKEFIKKKFVVEFFNKKPSESYKFLIENNFSTKDTKYSISEQEGKSISIFKYDLNSDLNVCEFCTSLISHHKKSGLSKILENVKINGDDKVALIQNLPDKKFIKIIKENLFNLLK